MATIQFGQFFSHKLQSLNFSRLILAMYERLKPPHAPCPSVYRIPLHTKTLFVFT